MQGMLQNHREQVPQVGAGLQGQDQRFRVGQMAPPHLLPSAISGFSSHHHWIFLLEGFHSPHLRFFNIGSKFLGQSFVAFCFMFVCYCFQSSDQEAVKEFFESHDCSEEKVRELDFR